MLIVKIAPEARTRTVTRRTADVRRRPGQGREIRGRERCPLCREWVLRGAMVTYRGMTSCSGCALAQLRKDEAKDGHPAGRPRGASHVYGGAYGSVR